jgi:hypothetical protein
MAIKRAKIRAGDVLELQAGSRFAYVQYIGKHPEYGDAILVIPGFHERETSLTSENFADGYVTFYPASAAASQGLVDVVSHLPPPPVPTRLRRAGRRSGTQVETWIIEEGAREVVKEKLSEGELRLPVASIWNHEFLIQRIAERWNPINYGRDP